MGKKKGTGEPVPSLDVKDLPSGHQSGLWAEWQALQFTAFL